MIGVRRDSRFIPFALVGTAGFLIDAGVLLIALHFGFGFYSGRFLSFLTAASATWALNRRFTFASSATRTGLHREWLRYVTTALVGGTVNYLTYFVCIAQWSFFRDYPALAVAIGSLAGLGVNFHLSSRYAFTRKQES